MFTKVYESIKKFIKENYKGLLLILFVYVLFNFQLPYSIYTPGGMINMSDRIESDDELNQSGGSINMTYVSLVKGTLPMLGLAKIFPSWDIVSNENITLDDESIKETLKRDQYYMKEAISNATLVAFNEANLPISIELTENIITYISDEADTDLKLYDNILSYDGIEYNSLEKLKEYISSKKINDIINFQVDRNGKKVNTRAKVIELDNELKIGIMTATINEYESMPDITVKTKSSESGPSGGFITALAIYDAITEYDLTQNRIIAGTGTIDKYGNVGEISGVTYKIAGAYKNGAQLFFCPASNYEEAKEFTENQGYDIIVVSVDTFRDAVNYLIERREN